MTMKNIARLTALAAALSLVAALPARAQWGPEEEKNCFTKGMKGTITIAGQTNSAQGDSSKLEQYEEIPKGFLVPCAAYGWENQNYSFDFKGIDVGYDDMFLGATFGKKCGFQLGASWDQNPNWQSNTVRTPFTYSERGNTGYLRRARRHAAHAAERLHAVGGADVEQPRRRGQRSRQPDGERLLRGRQLPRQPEPPAVRPALRPQDGQGGHRGPGGEVAPVQRELLP